MKSAITMAIEAHKAAVMVDEGQYDLTGESPESAATLRAENEAFKNFISTPCSNPEEVHTKIDYLLNGTVGERDKLVTHLLDDDSEADCMGAFVEKFLKSLVVGAPA